MTNLIFKKGNTILFIFILTIIIIFNNTAAGQMRQVYVDSFPGNNIQKISFYSPAQGYVSFSTYIGYTNDSGKTFSKKYVTNNNVNYNGFSVNLTFGFGISGVKALNQNKIIVYGDYGLVPAILYSTDGGGSYTLIFLSLFSPNNPGWIRDMIFPENNNIGYAIDPDRILKTSDGGLTWNVIYTSAYSYFDYLEAPDNNNVFAIAKEYNYNKLFKTNNGGTNWQNIALPALQDVKINYGSFISASKGWINVLDHDLNSYIYKTTTGGNSWVLQNEPMVTPFSSQMFKFVNDSVGFALSSTFDVFKTRNSGKVWEPLPRDNNYSYLLNTHYTLQCFSADLIWAGGGHGFLEFSNNGGGTPMPKAFFKINEVNIINTGKVNLVNYSADNYNYKWYKNDILINTEYNTSYTHNLSTLKDTISLVVSNNITNDTLVQFINYPAPISLTSFYPNSGTMGTTITITGNNLSSVKSVFFGGVPASSFNIISSTQINAVIAAGISGAVSISNSIRRDSLPGFTYTGLVITSASPLSGSIGSTITISGLNFSSVYKVSFGGTTASSFTIVDNTTITAVVGPGSSGPIEIFAGLYDYAYYPGFTYTGNTNITSFTPKSAGPRTGITITGVNFKGVTSVSFGGTPASSFTIISADTIVATTNEGSSGDISVTTPSITATKNGFQFIPVPDITSFSPTSGIAGTQVTIKGHNFSSTISNNFVSIGAVGTNIITASDTQLVITIPSGATFAPITVTSNHLSTVSKRPLILTYRGGNTISATTFTNTIDFPSLSYVPGSFFYDFDGDGKVDMLIIEQYLNRFSIFKNVSTIDSLKFGPALDFSSGPPFNEPLILIKVTDLDRDGKPDLILRIRETNYGGISIYTYKNISTNGVIAFNPRQLSVSIPAVAGQTFSGAEEMSFGDLDNDGRTDLLIWHGNVTPEKFYFYKNTSLTDTISFASSKLIYQNSSFYSISSVSFKDIDNDGKIDLLMTTNDYSGKIYISLNTTINNNLSFVTYPFSFDTNENGLTKSEFCDLDGDGKEDLILSNYIFNKVTILRNLSTVGTVLFAPLTNYTIDGKPGDVTFGDIDGDSKPDLAVNVTLLTLRSPETISIFKNVSTAGNITLSPQVNFVVGNNPGEIFIGDLNGDSRPELAFGHGYPDAVSIFSHEYITIANGNWNNPATWLDGMVPPLDVAVKIKHTVSVTINTYCYTLKVIAPGSVIVKSGVNFIITH